MAKPVLRGVLIAAFFAIVAFTLIPHFVPRPAFIPGFAPPPDMWPRFVALIGLTLGIAAAVLAVLGKTGEVEEPIESDGAPLFRLWMRFAALTALFLGFLVSLPWLGFLLASMLLTLFCVLLTGERGHRLTIPLLVVLGPILLLFFFHAALGIQFPKGALTKPFGF